MKFGMVSTSTFRDLAVITRLAWIPSERRNTSKN